MDCLLSKSMNASSNITSINHCSLGPEVPPSLLLASSTEGTLSSHGHKWNDTPHSTRHTERVQYRCVRIILKYLHDISGVKINLTMSFSSFLHGLIMPSINWKARLLLVLILVYEMPLDIIYSMYLWLWKAMQTKRTHETHITYWKYG